MAEKVNLQIQLTDITSETTILVNEEAIIENFNMKSELEIKEGEGQIIAKVTINGTSSDGSLLMTTKADFTFMIGDMHSVVKHNDKNELQIPRILLELINSTALATCRGIVYSGLKGSKLKNIVIPLINIQAMQQMQD
ncbi:MAG: hypothetical protein WC756_13455 [Taibaiella sp.]|jgi:hypothetical protein